MSSEPQRYKSPEELAALRAEKFSLQLDRNSILKKILSSHRTSEYQETTDELIENITLCHEILEPHYLIDSDKTPDDIDARFVQESDALSTAEVATNHDGEGVKTKSIFSAPAEIIREIDADPVEDHLVGTSIFSLPEFSQKVPEQQITNSVLVEEQLTESVNDHHETLTDGSQELEEQMPSSKFDTPKSAGDFSHTPVDALSSARVVLPRRRLAKTPNSSEKSVGIVETHDTKMLQGIPTRKHSAQELQQMRQRGLIETRPPMRHVLSMQLHPITTTLCYLISLSVIILSIRHWSHEGTQRLLAPSYGCSVLLILSLLIYWKKPRARHHAAFLIAVAVIVMGFVILYTFKNPYAA